MPTLYLNLILFEWPSSLNRLWYNIFYMFYILLIYYWLILFNKNAFCQSIIVCIKSKESSVFSSKRPNDGKLFQYYNFGFGSFTFNSNGIYSSSWFHTGRIIFFAIVAATSDEFRPVDEFSVSVQKFFVIQIMSILQLGLIWSKTDLY